MTSRLYFCCCFLLPISQIDVEHFCKELHLQECFLQACLYCGFTNAHCPNKEDIQAFLNNLYTK